MPAGRQAIVGLGNPGSRYAATRHNVGHRVVDRLAERLGARVRLRGPAAVGEAAWEAHRLYLAKPVSVMNASGPSVARLLRLLDLGPPNLILVYDDLDLPFGHVRVRHRGRHGGHNGVRSILETLGTEEIRRVKVGVGRPALPATPDEVADWVLTPFTPEERLALPAVVERAADLALALAADADP